MKTYEAEYPITKEQFVEWLGHLPPDTNLYEWSLPAGTKWNLSPNIIQGCCCPLDKCIYDNTSRHEFPYVGTGVSITEIRTIDNENIIKRYKLPIWASEVRAAADSIHGLTISKLLSILDECKYPNE